MNRYIATENVGPIHEVLSPGEDYIGVDRELMMNEAFWIYAQKHKWKAHPKDEQYDYYTIHIWRKALQRLGSVT